MIICKKCGKVVSYNSYFQKYICNCGWECTENDTKTDIEEDIRICNEIVKTNMFNRNTDAKAIENILAYIERIDKENDKLQAKANKYDSLVEKIKERIKSVEKCYEDLLTDLGGIKIINVSGLSKREKEEVINKRNCLIVQKATFEEILELLDTVKEEKQ